MLPVELAGRNEFPDEKGIDTHFVSPFSCPRGGVVEMSSPMRRGLTQSKRIMTVFGVAV